MKDSLILLQKDGKPFLFNPACFKSVMNFTPKVKKGEPTQPDRAAIFDMAGNPHSVDCQVEDIVYAFREAGIVIIEIPKPQVSSV